jgi:hypothetical protein
MFELYSFYNYLIYSFRLTNFTDDVKAALEGGLQGPQGSADWRPKIIIANY